MEELTRSVMESLDITQICLDLLHMLKATQDDGAETLCEAVKKEYLVCLQCHRFFTGSCPHCSQPAAEEDLPTLAAVLYAMNLLVREEVSQLELRLGLELAVGGEPLHAWEVTWLLPQMAPERCCRACKAPLPRSPGDSEGSQAWLPVLGAQGPPKGQAGPARQDARQAWAKRWAAGSAALQPAVPGESVPGLGPVWPLPPWAQPPPSRALDRLQRAGREPLPWVGYKGLGQGPRLQHAWQSWAKLKTSVRRGVRDEQGRAWRGGSSAPSGTPTGDRALPFDLRFKVDALFHSMVMEA
ncbi:hypothetical protein GRJ2_000988100 [Grus japonensis]|uniref:KIND domain-containing protein n=1 Tax=Grus japonensis TaxID=30415 RepID=A0ABC9WJ08_GRUJA